MAFNRKPLSLPHLRSRLYILIILATLACPLIGQKSLLAPADSLNKTRLYSGIGVGAVTYGIFAFGLNDAWYADFDRSGFHLFNDWGEWEHMDKFGHAYNGYFQSRLVYQGARWTGLNKNQSIWVGIGTSMLFQTTIEVLDGFSKEWGFSIPDMAFNVGGAALFGLQQHYWDEQKIRLKLSSHPRTYPNDIVISNNGQSLALKQRAEDLYGADLLTRILKDYNAQTVWVSANIASFVETPTCLPKWLNIAVGYGAENMYGGFDNEWETDDGDVFFTDRDRYRQYYLSFDIDMTRIKTNNDFVRTLLSILNIIKLPSPTLEYSRGGFKGHWLFY